uniref:Uncharacterized protein n=1 Tax=Glossina pallidipes TaxID=7398 RepID=A0A1A9ZUG4_GLOPL
MRELAVVENKTEMHYHSAYILSYLNKSVDSWLSCRFVFSLSFICILVALRVRGTKVTKNRLKSAEAGAMKRIHLFITYPRLVGVKLNYIKYCDDGLNSYCSRVKISHTSCPREIHDLNILCKLNNKFPMIQLRLSNKKIIPALILAKLCTHTKRTSAIIWSLSDVTCSNKQRLHRTSLMHNA